MTPVRRIDPRAYGLVPPVGTTRAKAKPKPPAHKTGEMNGVEISFSAHLEDLRREGLVKTWDFESIKFRLADSTHYTPDFAVVDQDDRLILYEVKAWWKATAKRKEGPRWEDDARVKIKVAAKMFPFEFRAAAQKPNGEWHVEVF